MCGNNLYEQGFLLFDLFASSMNYVTLVPFLLQNKIIIYMLKYMQQIIYTYF